MFHDVYGVTQELKTLTFVHCYPFLGEMGQTRWPERKAFYMGAESPTNGSRPGRLFYARTLLIGGSITLKI